MLNALTGSQVSAEDRPFETLDTSSRRLRFPRDREVIITDTVGFIRDLPKTLVAPSCKPGELRDADALLIVQQPRLDTPIEAVATILVLDLVQSPHPRPHKCDKLTPDALPSL